MLNLDTVRKRCSSGKQFDYLQALRLITEGTLGKVRQNPALERFLISTSDMVLVEASPTHCIWGIGLEADDERATNPLEWQGTNLLGIALMDARDNLIGRHD